GRCLDRRVCHVSNCTRWVYQVSQCPNYGFEPSLLARTTTTLSLARECDAAAGRAAGDGTSVFGICERDSSFCWHELRLIPVGQRGSSDGRPTDRSLGRFPTALFARRRGVPQSVRLGERPLLDIRHVGGCTWPRCDGAPVGNPRSL